MAMYGQQAAFNPAFGSYNYNPNMMGQAPQKIPNFLNDDEIKYLQQNGNQFSLGLTQREILQGSCNHRSPDGMSDSLVFDPATGVARCTICGYEFRPLEPDTSVEDITEAKDKIIDILQTIKLLYNDLPAAAGREYFQVIPLLEKLPELFQFAAKNFAKHEMLGNWQYNNPNMGGYAMLQSLGNFFGAGQTPMYQQPMYQQPMMGQVAPGYPQAAYQPVQPGMNAFGYPGASQQQPVNQGYAYQPGQVMTPVQPTVNPVPAAPVAPTATPAAPATAAPTETVVQQVQA